MKSVRVWCWLAVILLVIQSAGCTFLEDYNYSPVGTSQQSAY